MTSYAVKAAPLLVLLGVALLLLAPPLIADEVCMCADARLVNGWCAAHEVGYVAGLEIRSADLFEALDAHGHQFDPDRLGCARCRDAYPEGYCEEHHRGFIDGLTYFSTLTYHLAKGRAKSSAEITCPVCRNHSESHGWCSKCEVGMVGNVEIRNRKDFQIASEEYDKLLEARQTAVRCEMCAVAMIYDGTCPSCKITYKDGEPVKAQSK